MKKILKALSFFILFVFLSSSSINALVLIVGGDSFPDTVGHEYEEAIKFLKDQGIVEGYPDGNFRPDQEINRAEFTKIVGGSVFTEIAGEDCFPDVHDEWFAP